MTGRIQETLAALDKVAEVLQAERKPRTALKQLTSIVRDHMSATNAKVIVVTKREGRPLLEHLSRTDIENMGDLETNVVELNTKKGLADWVVLNEDWLLIRDVGESFEESGEVIAETGKNGTVTLVPRQEREVIADALDNESSMLFVPLRAAGRTCGSLAVWREDGAPFDPTIDPDELLRIAPHVAAACRQVVLQGLLRQELEQVSLLATVLDNVDDLRSAYGAVAQGISKLSGAELVVLLHHDPDHKGHLYHRVAWKADSSATQPDIYDGFAGLHVSLADPSGNWRDTVHEVAQVRRRQLTESRTTVPVASIHCGSDDGEGYELPRIVAILLDSDTDIPRPYFADDMMLNSALSFLHYGAAMLTSSMRVLPLRLLDGVSGIEGEESPGRADLVSRAAETLRSTTNAEVALVYQPDTAGRMSVSLCIPRNDVLIGTSVATGSLTEKVVRDLDLRRVVDIDDQGDSLGLEMDRRKRMELIDKLGWEKVKSWLCLPIVYRGRCMGLIKLLNGADSSFLGKDHELLADVLANRLGWELQKLDRRLMLEALNELAESLSSLSGDKLAAASLSGLEEWVARFVQPGTRVGLFTWILPEETLVEAVSRELSADVEDLRSISRVMEDRELCWSAGDKIEATGRRRSDSGIAVPIKLPKNSYLKGHLILVNQDPFGEYVRTHVQEAARELGILLNSECLRRMWKRSIGRFRHALIGPIQGLVSRSKALVRLQVGNKGKEIDALRSGIEEEAEIVRLWRDNQRLYQKDAVEIRKRRHALKHVFDRNVERYRPMFSSRGIQFNVCWEPRGGELRFRFDEDAIDLCISNLLDNARKYCFYNRAAGIGATSLGEEVEIWVEDEGHPIPKELDPIIYQETKRLTWEDPLRTIAGEGLGLPLTKRLVEAHGGTVDHASTKITSGPTSDRTPYRVRFTVRLPTSWGLV